MSIRFIYIDAKTGFILSRQMLPVLPDAPPEGQRIVVPDDGQLPAADLRIDLRKARKPVNHVASIEDVLANWSPPELSPVHALEQMKEVAIFAVDKTYAEWIEKVQGPLAGLHAEKRRQAEAGGGPLIVDEEDRLAILAKAAEQDEILFAIDAERRSLKMAIKSAESKEEIDLAAAKADKGTDSKGNKG